MYQIVFFRKKQMHKRESLFRGNIVAKKKHFNNHPWERNAQP
jgi:hypothetical protein